jgi:hypothetical protein
MGTTIFGTMKSRWAQLALAAALGGATIPLVGSSAHAFTLQNLGAPSDGSSFDDSQARHFGGGNGVQLGDGGPVVQFGGSTQSGMGPFNHFGPGAGFAPTPRPPEPYAIPNND